MFTYSLDCQELVFEGCTFHIHLFSLVPRTCLRGLLFSYPSIVLSAKNLPLRAALFIPIYCLECQELAFEGCTFHMDPSIVLSAKNLPLRAVLSVSIYSVECLKLALEGCTIYSYLFSLVSRTCLWGLHFLYYLFSWVSRTCLRGLHFLYYLCLCLDATDLKLSQLIWPAARGRRNDEMIRLWVW